MKAYMISDRKGYSEYSLIVFAESRGKAISSAIGTDEFPKYEWDFTELRAVREPVLDKAYRGCWRMEWDYDQDRLALVKDAGYYCDEDGFYPDEECIQCVAKDYCTKYQDYLEEMAEWGCDEE